MTGDKLVISLAIRQLSAMSAVGGAAAAQVRVPHAQQHLNPRALPTAHQRLPQIYPIQMRHPRINHRRVTQRRQQRDPPIRDMRQALVLAALDSS